MARTASLAHPVEPLPLSGGPRSDPALAGDHIGFDAWLLPPEAPDPMERAVRLCSFAAGPLAFAIALAFVVSRIA